MGLKYAVSEKSVRGALCAVSFSALPPETPASAVTADSSTAISIPSCAAVSKTAEFCTDAMAGAAALSMTPPARERDVAPYARKYGCKFSRGIIGAFKISVSFSCVNRDVAYTLKPLSFRPAPKP